MPKTKTKRVGSDKLLAKIMKPSGRLTQDDRRRASNVLRGLGLTAAQKLKLVKNLKNTGVISSDQIKAGAAMIKEKKPKAVGVPGMTKKFLGVKKRGGKVSGKDANMKKKISKNVKLLQERFKANRIKNR